METEGLFHKGALTEDFLGSAAPGDFRLALKNKKSSFKGVAKNGDFLVIPEFLYPDGHHHFFVELANFAKGFHSVAVKTELFKHILSLSFCCQVLLYTQRREFSRGFV